MDFYVWGILGGAVGLLAHYLGPERLRLGVLLSCGLGILGAFGGALVGAALVDNNWVEFGFGSLVGSVLGAAVTLVFTPLIVFPPRRSEPSAP
jgi:uncharacterized membrane protein YeaQ/YmgE (transglycosylase-associated protein family)